MAAFRICLASRAGSFYHAPEAGSRFGRHPRTKRQGVVLADARGMNAGPSLATRVPSNASPSPDAGFWLVEAVVAAGLFALLAAGVAQLSVMSYRATRLASRESIAHMLAVQKMEELQGTTWTYLGSASVRGAGQPPLPVRVRDGGRAVGQLQTGSATLSRDVSGYVDYQDPHGGWLGAGPSPPVGLAYVRRWSVRSHPHHPRRLLVVDVVVVSSQWISRSGGGLPTRSDPGVVWLTALKGLR